MTDLVYIGQRKRVELVRWCSVLSSRGRAERLDIIARLRSCLEEFPQNHPAHRLYNVQLRLLEHLPGGARATTRQDRDAVTKFFIRQRQYLRPNYPCLFGFSRPGDLVSLRRFEE